MLLSWLLPTWPILYIYIEQLDMWMKPMPGFTLWASGGFDLVAFLCMYMHCLWNLWEEPHPIAITLMTPGSHMTTTTHVSLHVPTWFPTQHIHHHVFVILTIPPPGPSYTLLLSIWISMCLHDSPLIPDNTILVSWLLPPTVPYYKFRLSIGTCEWNQFHILPCELLVDLI